jgi:hypothetical protein
LPVADPLALIRSRIREKRIFEARFLCRQLGQEIDRAQKKALEQELSGILERVARLRQEASVLLAQGEHGKAGALYAEMEAMAIDVPGVAEEKRRVASAEALAVRMGVNTVPQKSSGAEQNSVAKPSGPQAITVAPPWHRWPRLLVAVLLGLLGVVVLLLFRTGSDPSSPVPTAPPAEMQKIVIRPLADPSTMADNSPAPEPASQAATSVPEAAPPDTPSSGQESLPPGAPPSAVHLGTLKVENSTR